MLQPSAVTCQSKGSRGEGEAREVELGEEGREREGERKGDADDGGRVDEGEEGKMGEGEEVMGKRRWGCGERAEEKCCIEWGWRGNI